MNDFFKTIHDKNIVLPDNVAELLQHCKKATYFDTNEELFIAATNGIENSEYAVTYDVPGMGKYTEAEKYFLETLEGRKRVLGENHPNTISTQNQLDEFYKLLNLVLENKSPLLTVGSVIST